MRTYHAAKLDSARQEFLQRAKNARIKGNRLASWANTGSRARKLKKHIDVSIIISLLTKYIHTYQSHKLFVEAASSCSCAASFFLPVALFFCE